MPFSNNLALYRKRAGMSQEDLAEQLHVSRQTISKWETGQSAPDPDTVLQVADLLQIPVEHLLRGKSETPPPTPQAAESPAVAEPPSPQPAKPPLLDTHVLGRYIFLAVMFLGGILLFGLYILSAYWGLWFVSFFDILICFLMMFLMTAPPLFVTVHYVRSKCRAAKARRRAQKEKPSE